MARVPAAAGTVPPGGLKHDDLGAPAPKDPDHDA
jgi:hypothetical protein